jgi:hypothetical protein
MLRRRPQHRSPLTLALRHLHLLDELQRAPQFLLALLQFGLRLVALCPVRLQHV